MRNKIAVVFLALVFASLSHAKIYGPFHDFSGAFRNFTLGTSVGVGTSMFVGDEDIYDADSTEAGFYFDVKMAFPLNENMAVVTNIGVRNWSFRSNYIYLHRPVCDSVDVLSIELASLWEIFLSKHFFIGLGPNIRIPFIEERVTLDGREVFSGKPSYARKLWLNIDMVVGAKLGALELGFRSGFETLGFYKKTKEYRKVDMRELRCDLYLTYWFGYWINGNR